MKKIYKYWVTDYPVMQLPRGARVLDVQEQRQGQLSSLQLWALVDPGEQAVDCPVVVANTGEPLKDGATALTHIATCQIGPLVQHVFADGWDPNNA